MITLGLVALAILATAGVLFAFMTLAMNANANREDLLDAAPSISASPSVFLRTLHGAAGERPSRGNQIDLLQNGNEIFPAMIGAIREAQETVHFATYVWWEGVDVPGVFTDLFCETSRRGVKVRIVVDSEGAGSMSEESVREMREAGCIVTRFRAAKWDTWMRYNHRSHRRLLVVDGVIGFTGGVGIADEWSGNAENSKHWRDTHARVRGPAVSSLQSAFADNWNKASQELLLNERDYPEIGDAGTMESSIVVSTPVRGSSAAQRTMASLIAGASKTLHITNAYFIPTPAFVHNLCEAAKRGVEVKVIVPGPHHDMPVVRYASWHSWPRLMGAGVRIFEYQPTMIHCKTLVADDEISLVGSINFDPRSFALNLECGVVVADRGVAAGMERAFAADLERSKEIELADVRGRSTFAKVRDAACYWIRGQL